VSVVCYIHASNVLHTFKYVVLTLSWRLLQGIEAKRPAEVQTLMLQRHLHELTQSFLIPLEQYLRSLMPLQKDILPHCAPPQLKTFDTDKFLETVERCSPELTSGVKGDWLGLYRQVFLLAATEWLVFLLAVRVRYPQQLSDVLH
jgi:hypothetical protein